MSFDAKKMYAPEQCLDKAKELRELASRFEEQATLYQHAAVKQLEWALECKQKAADWEKKSKERGGA